jgi:2-(1,2-epoxy-1,2-dihydrophenyl)acetyl-CoA isomerase
MDYETLRKSLITSASVYQKWPELELRIEHKIATITFSRPHASNCLNLSAINALKTALTTCAQSVHVKVVCLTGSGNAFCAGQDLKECIADDAPALTDFLYDRHHPVLDMIRDMGKPVIAAVNGAAVGAGMSLALACDIIVAQDDAYFIQSFSKIGLVPDCGSTYMLPRMIGKQKSAAMMMLAEKMSAQQAEAWGMIYKAVPAPDFAAEVAAVCGRLVDLPRASLGWIKQALHSSEQNDWHTQLDVEASLLAKAGATPDYREGVSAFLEKRAPVFA